MKTHTSFPPLASKQTLDGDKLSPLHNSSWLGRLAVLPVLCLVPVLGGLVGGPALGAEALTLAGAVDATNLVWTTGGAVDWLPETTMTHDGSDAAQGAVNIVGDRSWIGTSVSGPLQVSFWWKCYTQWPDYDRLAFYIDEELAGSINGATDWSPAAFAIPAGSHVLTWNFEVDSEPWAGDPQWAYAAYLDQVTFSGAPSILQQPLASDTVVAGSGIMLGVRAVGASALSYQWQKDGVNLPNQTNATLTLLNLQESDAGNYRVIVSSGGTTLASSESVISVLPASAGAGCAGSLDPSFDAGRGAYPCLWPPWAPTPITSVTPQAGGKVVIAGGFNQVQGLEVPGIARYEATGWIDSNYVANPADVVSHRRFTQPNGKVVRTCDPEEDLGLLARFNPNGSLDPTFIPAVPEGFVVNAIGLQPDGKILVAAVFYNADPIYEFANAINLVARLLPNGEADASFISRTNAGVVFDLVLAADGRIYIGGFFTAINGVPRSDVARLNPDGTLDLSFEADLVVNVGADISELETISALGLAADGKLFVAGYLGRFNGFGRAAVARLHTAQDGCGGGIVSVEETAYYTYETNSQVTVAFVRTAGAEQSASVRFTSSNGSAVAGQDFGPVEGELVFAPGEARKTVSIPIFNDTEPEHTEGFSVQLLIDSLSNMVTLNLRARASVMIFDDDSASLPGSLDETFALPLLDGPVRRLVLGANGSFFAAGAFTHAGDQPRTGLARFTVAGQLDTSFNPVVDGAILDLAFEAASGKLYLAGNFNHVNGAPCRAVARINSNGSLDETFNSSLTGGAVEHLALCASGKVLIAGGFTIQTPVLRQTLARLNPDGSLDAALNIGTSSPSPGSIMSLVALADDKILIGGQFNNINGDPCSQIARLNADGSFDSVFNRTRMFGYLQSMRLGVLADGKILVGGHFYRPSMLGGPLGLLRLNSDGTSDPSWHEGPFTWAFAMQTDGKILINGNQRLFPDGIVDLDYFSCGYGGGIADLLLLPNGEVLAGGDFTTAEGHFWPYLVRLYGGDSRNFGPGYLSFTSPNWGANQGAPSVTLQVQRSYGAAGPVSVNFTTADGTASNGLDYVAQSGTITFADGDMQPKTLTVPLLTNPNRDGHASFQVVLSQPTGGARLGANASASVTLVDTNVVIRIGPQIVSVNESNHAVAFQVLMTGWSSTPVTCQYATRSGTATAGTDFTPVSGTFNFGTGPYSINWFQVPILNDSLVEGTETFTVYLTNATGGAVLRASSVATVIILDDETPPADIAAFSGSPQTGSSQFTLTIGNELGRPYVIEASTNLTTWDALGTVTNFADWVQFTDPTPDGKQKFYRVRARQ